MTNLVTVTQGSYRNEEVHNQIFEMVQDVKHGAKGSFITVRPNSEFGGEQDKIRIKVHANHVQYHSAPNAEASKLVESDEVVMARIAERFDILEEMTKAAIEGNVRGMIVVGPPGVGKSYGVTKQLEQASLFDNIKGDTKKYEIAKGAMTPIGLYMTLYNNSAKNTVLVFDDCDMILMDDLSLNLLKAALDSGGKRTISWHSDSSALRNEGIPNQFEFNGSVIFITNLNFDNLKSKKLQDHLMALQSRCHYLDLTMRTMRDRVLRIKQIHATGELFQNYRFKNGEGDAVVEYMIENQDRLREMSLRMALKIADLFKVSSNWKRLAETTVMKNSF